MAAPAEAISKIQAGLEQYVKPREQVNYIRRILALHLGSSTGDGAAVPPLALTNCTRLAGVGDELTGIYRAYVEALQANAAACRQLDAVLQDARQESGLGSETPSHGSDLLDGHLALLRLRQKRDCLLAVQQSLKLLVEKPAFRQGFLDTDKVLQDTPALPEVPKSVIDSIVPDQSTAQPDLQSRVHQLDKELLQAKLRLKQEQGLLAESKARREDIVAVRNGAKLEALRATRCELIAWIEAELSMASAQEPEASRDDQTLRRARVSTDSQAIVAAQLRQINQKYDSYVASRREVLALACTRLQPSMSPPRQQAATSEHANDADPAPPVDYLLTPYVETLLSLSRHQKSLMAHKSHSISVLNKQTMAACQSLDRLAEESQLLPSYPMNNPPPRRPGIANDAFGSSHQPNISNRVSPWVMAAESAKMATLEAVAETIEGGQLALESCMKSLQDIDQLLGQDTADDETMPGQQIGDPWSRLHGNLGFIGHDGATDALSDGKKQRRR